MLLLPPTLHFKNFQGNMAPDPLGWHPPKLKQPCQAPVNLWHSLSLDPLLSEILDLPLLYMEFIKKEREHPEPPFSCVYYSIGLCLWTTVGQVTFLGGCPVLSLMSPTLTWPTAKPKALPPRPQPQPRCFAYTDIV